MWFHTRLANSADCSLTTGYFWKAKISVTFFAAFIFTSSSFQMCKCDYRTQWTGQGHVCVPLIQHRVCAAGRTTQLMQTAKRLLFPVPSCRVLRWLVKDTRVPGMCASTPSTAWLTGWRANTAESTRLGEYKHTNTPLNLALYWTESVEPAEAFDLPTVQESIAPSGLALS